MRDPSSEYESFRFLINSGRDLAPEEWAWINHYLALADKATEPDKGRVIEWPEAFSAMSKAA